MRWHIYSRSWISILIPFLGIVLLYRFIDQEMRSNTRKSFMAAVAASLARHGNAQAVDLSWHAPNATVINNLTQVIEGSGVYGFIYDSSTTPDSEYGTYNWCNMPHVRAEEYKKPSSEYKLQYVEVVSWHCYSDVASLISTRSTAITNEPSMPPTPSQSNHMDGTVMTRACSTMDSQPRGGSLHTRTGRDITLPRTHSCPLAFLVHVNSHKLLQRVWTTHGSTEKICMESTTTS